MSGRDPNVEAALGSSSDRIGGVGAFSDPGREANFRSWLATQHQAPGVDPNPDNPDHHYDYRAAYLAGASPDPATLHWPSEFKTSGHPRTYMSPDGQSFSESPSPGWVDTRTGSAVPSARDSNVEAALGGDTDPTAALRQSWTVGTSRDPDAYAKTLATSRALGIAPDHVEGNPDIAAQIEAQNRLDPDALGRLAPMVAAWLAKPENASIAHDDLSNLTGLEFAFRALPRAFGQGVASMGSGLRKAAGAIGLPGLADPGALLSIDFRHPVLPDVGAANDAAIAALDERASQPIDESTLLRKALVETARFGPVLAGSIGASAALGPEAGLGMTLGYFGVTGYGTSKYRMAAFRDESGRPLPEGLQQIGSIVIGGIDAALGAVKLDKITKALPGARGVIEDAAAEAVAKLLTRPTFQAALRDRAKQFGESAVTASLASAGMTAAQMVADASVVAASGQKVDLPTFRANIGAIAESAYTGLLIGGTTGAAGLGWNLPRDYVRSERAKQAQGAMVEMGAKAQSSKVLPRNPAALGELAASAAEAGQAPEHVFMPQDAFTTLFQSRGADPNEAASQLGISREYAEAKATGGDVAIPFGTYVEKIAGTELHEASLPDVRFDPGDMTARESASFDKAQSTIPDEMKAIVAERATGEASAGQGVYEAVKAQLVATGKPENVADYEATVHQAFFRAAGSRTGQTPENLAADYPLAIVREETPAGDVPRGTLAQRAVGAIKTLFQGKPPAEPPKPDETPFTGSYTVESGGATIRLSASDNLSTFLHETGHHFLRVTSDLAAKEGAPEAVKADHRAILDWLGAKDTASIMREQHEKFADGFLTYLREGKAPTIELASAFARFRAWLAGLLPKINALVTLNPEIRDVFRRMLATDQEISAAENDQGFGLLFETAASGRATEAEFKAYQAGERRAKREARENLTADIEGQVQRETTSWWKEEKAKTTANVTAEFNARPEYVASHFLRTGTMIEGGDVPASLQDEAGQPLRLDQGVVEKMYGPIAKTVERAVGVTAFSKDGAHPDVIAEQMGYGSGREMIDALVRERPGDSAIRAEVTRRMLAEHGDVLNDGTIQTRAQDIVHKIEARQRQLLTEERFLRRLAEQGGLEPSPRGDEARREAALIKSVEKGQAAAESAARKAAVSAGRVSPLSFAYMRTQARELIGSVKVRYMNPRLHLAAERNAFERVTKAMAKQDYAAALDAQRQRLSAFAMYLEASAAKIEGDKAGADLKNWNKEPARAKLGKVDGNLDTTYLDQQDKLLERFGLRQPISLAEVDKRAALAEWVAQMVAIDFDPAIPAKMLDETYRTNWRDLTHDDLIGLHDAIQNIRTQASRDGKILVQGRMIERKAYLAELIQAFQALLARSLEPTSGSSRGTLDATHSIGSGARASLRKIEEVCLQIDGGKPDGPAMRGIFQPMADAEVRARDQAKTTLDAVTKYAEAMPTELRASMREKVPIPGSKRAAFARFERVRARLRGEPVPVIDGPVSLTRAEIMAVGFNALGNAENYQRLLQGGNARFKVWNEATIKAITDTLTREQLDYMQGMGDVLHSFWPEIEAQRKRLVGSAPPGVEPAPFTREFADGTTKSYAGWYYPLVDDPLYSRRRAAQVDPASDSIFSPSYARALPSNSFAHGRVEGYVSPLSLEVGHLPAHIANVIHDLTHREALISVRSILQHPDVKDAMRRTLGPEQQRQFMPWLQYVANRQAPPVINGAAWLDHTLNKLRTNVTMASLGFRWSTAVVHSVGWVQALDMVPAEHMATATRDYFADMGGVSDWIAENSGTMRHLSESYDRDLSDAFDDVRGKTDFKSEVSRFGMLGLTYVRKVSGDSAFLGAYRHAIAPESTGGFGLDHARAVEWAESVARRSVGAGSPKDLAPIQRGSALSKLFTMFYSWGSTRYQRLDTLAIDVKKQAEGRDGPGWGPIAARSFYLALLIPVMSALLKGRTPKKKDEEAWAEFALANAAMGAVEPIPVLRDFAGAYERGADVTLSPASSAAEKVYLAGKYFVPAFKGGYDPTKEIFNFGRAAGYITGYPVDAPLSSAKYLWELETGEEPNVGPFGTAYGVLYGRSPKK